jgi:hypothetical protein
VVLVTGASSGIVELTPSLARTLPRHLLWLKTEALRRGSGEPVWLFPSEAGTPLDKARRPPRTPDRPDAP